MSDNDSSPSKKNSNDDLMLFKLMPSIEKIVETRFRELTTPFLKQLKEKWEPSFKALEMKISNVN